MIMSAQCSVPQLTAGSEGRVSSRGYSTQYSIQCEACSQRAAVVTVLPSGPQVLSACWWGCPSDSSPLALLWGSKWMQRLIGNSPNMMPPGPWDPKLKTESF